jgi:hypothetical protein
MPAKKYYFKNKLKILSVTLKNNKTLKLIIKSTQ